MGILTPPKKKGLLGDPAAMLRAAPDSYAPMLPNGGEQLPMDEQPMPQPMLGDVASPQAPIRKPGFFEDGGVGRRLAGTLGDTLATWAGGQAVYEPMMERRQALQHEQTVHDRDLQDSITKFKAEQEWKLAHPQPANNDTSNDYEFYRQKFGPDFADNWLKFNAANVRQPDGTYVSAASGWGGSTPLPALPPGITVDPQPMGGSAPKGPATFPSSVMDGLIGVESGGRPGVLGPMTQYGQAQGLTQMLPGTAQDMARKTGVEWRPELMTGTSKEASDYQRQLGQAYLEQGLQVTGNLPDALKYYHGGPDRKKWGPKTRAYSANVLSRAGIN